MLPKLIMFDYGETLAHEDDYRARDGFAAILKYAVENPMAMDADALADQFRSAYYDLRRQVQRLGVEIPNLQRWKWLFEANGLRFSLPDAELEDVFWTAAAPCVPTPMMPQLLALLREKNIRTGVISNMGFSGRALSRRLTHLFPEHPFDFVISSADYVFRKPNPRLFELGLRRVGCSAAEAWFLGDNPRCDIVGAASAGVFPVYYTRDLGCAYREQEEAVLPDCLQIADWSELIALLADPARS